MSRWGQKHTLKISKNYQVKSFWQTFKRTLEKVQQGAYLTRRERQEFYRTANKIGKIQEEFSTDPRFLVQRDAQGYISRSQSVIDSIKEQLRGGSDYKWDSTIQDFTML